MSDFDPRAAIDRGYRSAPNDDLAEEWLFPYDPRETPGAIWGSDPVEVTVVLDTGESMEQFMDRIGWGD